MVYVKKTKNSLFAVKIFYKKSEVNEKHTFQCGLRNNHEKILHFSLQQSYLALVPP